MNKNKEVEQIYKRPTVRISKELHARIKVELVKKGAIDGRNYTFQWLINDLLEKWIKEVTSNEE